MTKMRIGDLFELEKGLLQSSKCTEGEYDFITAAKEWKTHNEFSHNVEALIFAAMASGSLGRTHYVNGKFITSDLCYIMTPKDNEKYPINLKFYHFVFNSLREEIVKNTKSGTSKEAINQSNLNNYEIPYFDIEQQHLWIERLINTKNTKEDLVSEIDTQQTLLKKLRQSILQEAIEGKLTASWREQNSDVESASILLEKIKAEKEQLVKKKKIKAQKPLPKISEDEIPFDIPDSWEWCRLQEISDGFQYGTSAKSLKEGLIPVLRMGNIQNGSIIMNNLVYTSDKEEIEKYNLSYEDLLFNRTNSRELVGKTAIYDLQEKVIYAGYLVRFYMIGSIPSQYINYLMNSDLHRSWCDEVKIDALGQSNINATKLKFYRVPLPPLEEQKEIVKKIESLFKICDDLETQINSSKINSQTLMQAVLKEAFEKDEKPIETHILNFDFLNNSAFIEQKVIKQRRTQNRSDFNRTTMFITVDLNPINRKVKIIKLRNIINNGKTLFAMTPLTPFFDFQKFMETMNDSVGDGFYIIGLAALASLYELGKKLSTCETNDEITIATFLVLSRYSCDKNQSLSLEKIQSLIHNTGFIKEANMSIDKGTIKAILDKLEKDYNSVKCTNNEWCLVDIIEIAH